jgi:hypothetical protein
MVPPTRVSYPMVPASLALSELTPVHARQRLAQEVLVESARVGVVGPHNKLLQQPLVLSLQSLVLGL